MPDAPGLFTWSGAPGMPAAGTLVNGLAGSIRLNAAIDSAQGGNPALLRDGGANGAAYVANTSGGVLLFRPADRLWRPHRRADGVRPGRRHQRLGKPERLFQPMPSAGSRAPARRVHRAGIQARRWRCARAEALSNDTGVNVDTEMSLLLDLEHSYEASARLI